MDKEAKDEWTHNEWKSRVTLVDCAPNTRVNQIEAYEYVKELCGKLVEL